MFKKDKKEKTETVNLRELSTKLTEESQPETSGENPDNHDYVEFERITDRAQRSKPTTRESSRDRSGNRGEPLQDIIDRLKGDMAFT